MLHLHLNYYHFLLSLARSDCFLLLSSFLDALVVENYFGTVTDVENALAHLQGNHPDAVYGVNVLDDDAAGFALAERYGASFVQLDSVAGHLAPEDDGPFEERLRQWRAGTSAPVSYTHLRAPETALDIVCPLLLEKKKKKEQTETQSE